MQINNVVAPHSGNNMQKENHDLIPCDRKQGYFVVPGIERFSVCREGFVYDRLNNEIASSSLNTDVANTKTYLSVYDNPVHRMVAETFLSKEHIPTSEATIVNHLDGDIRNNHYKNLEWTTYSGNSIHAFMTGLRPDNIPLLCKNVETSEVTRFYSYWDCARVFKTNGANVFNYLNRKNVNRLFLDNYILIREGEPWPDIDIELCKSLASKDLLLHNKETKTGYILANASDVSRFLDVSPALISKLLKRMRSQAALSVEWNAWIIIPLNRAEDWMKENAKDERSVEKSNRKTPEARRKPKEVTVTSLNTKESKHYKSLEDFCNEIGEKKNTVQKHILVNNGIWRGEYEIRYL